MRHSFHNHTVLCGHGSGTVDDYVREARNSGIESIGISEHIPFPDGRWSGSRMAMELLPAYIDEVTRAQAAYSDIDVLLGGECEWVEEFSDHYRMLKEEHQFAYLIGAPHWTPMGDGTWLGYTHLETPKHLRKFSEHVQEIIESGFFVCIAHPDVFLAGYTRWDENSQACARDIIRCAAEHDIPLELNANGLRKKKITAASGELRRPYPVREFWETAAAEEVPMIVGADAHNPKHIIDSTDICYAWVEEFGLKDYQDYLYRQIASAREHMEDERKKVKAG